MPPAPDRPVVTVVGLGPAGPELLTEQAREAVGAAATVYLRTARHPAAADPALAGAATFDHHYEAAGTFDEVYRRIVEDLVAAAGTKRPGGSGSGGGGPAGDRGPGTEGAAGSGSTGVGARAGVGGTGGVVYAVPGSPTVAERTVDLLRADGRVAVRVLPALSFLDLAWDRLGVDPVDAGVRLVDGTRFAVEAAGARGPLLVAQCWSPAVLSEVKLSVDAGRQPPGGVPGERLTATVLHHLGLPDEQVVTVAWDELDRALVPDHLTSVWIPRLAVPVAGELVALDELARRLRRDCSWDRVQTHASLTRYLLEEAYEVIDAVGELERSDDAYEHLEEELGDVLFQVYFHSVLGAEEGRFTLADVARGVHDKLVARHPHVFGDVEAADAGTVVRNWEEIKREEKGRQSVTDGIPAALPALALAAKLARKAESVPGMALEGFEEQRARAAAALAGLVAPAGDPAELGDLLWRVADLTRQLGVDPEDALRAAALRFRDQIRAAELRPAGPEPAEPAP